MAEPDTAFARALSETTAQMEEAFKVSFFVQCLRGSFLWDEPGPHAVVWGGPADWTTQLCEGGARDDGIDNAKAIEHERLVTLARHTVEAMGVDPEELSDHECW